MQAAEEYIESTCRKRRLLCMFTASGYVPIHEDTASAGVSIVLALLGMNLHSNSVGMGNKLI